MKYFVGIRCGSSKTHALIVDETGNVVGFGKAGGGNYQAVGYEGWKPHCTSRLRPRCKCQAWTRPDRRRRLRHRRLRFPSDREVHLQAIASLGLSCPVEVVNDGVNGLLAGATRGIGVNVTAGSSNNCRGRNKDGKEGRIVGNGATFGEFGGAMEIVQRGLQMVNYAWIKRRPPTALTQIYLEAVGAKDELDLMEGLSNEHYHLPPSLAMQVIRRRQRRRRRRAGGHPMGGRRTGLAGGLGGASDRDGK